MRSAAWPRSPNKRRSLTGESTYSSLSDFYTQDANGLWIAPASPPTGFSKLPTCPSCRTPFFFRRYGRPIRKAALDVLEQNLVFESSAQLQTLSEKLTHIDKVKLIEQVEGFSDEVFVSGEISGKKAFDNFRKAVVQASLKKAAQADQPAPILAIFIPKAGDHLGARLLKNFKMAAAPLFEAYKSAITIAQQKSAHLAMWESTFASRHNTILAQGLEPELAFCKSG